MASVEAKKTMKAMVLENAAPAESHPMKLREHPLPELHEHEVLVRVRLCGVCRTDLHTVEGDIRPPHLPVIPGHQVVGVVERCGPQVKEIRVGDRLGVAWLRWTCGQCEFCRAGRENLCAKSRYTGFDADGGYAEYVAVDERYAYQIPAELDDATAAPLLCAGIIGYRAFKRSGVCGGQRLGLYGFGSSAHITLQVACHLGCEVFVWSRGEAHRTLARELGARWCGEPGERPPKALHGSIIFAPVGTVVPQALRDLESGGTVVIAGIHLTDVPSLNYEEHLFREKVLTSVTANTREDGRELLGIASRFSIRVHTSRHALEDANRVLVELKEGRIDGTALLDVGRT